MEHGWPAGVRWNREYARIAAAKAKHKAASAPTAANGPWATLVYVPSDGVLPRLTLRIFDRGERVPEGIDFGAGPTRVDQFPSDPDLPALASVLAEHVDAEVVRYRPGHRCTLRVDDGIRYLKVLSDTTVAARIHDEATQLWDASQRGELRFSVAAPDRHEPRLGAVWQRTVAGHSIAGQLGGPDGNDTVHRIGLALGSLARSTVRPSMAIAAETQWARTNRAFDRVRSVGDAFAERADRCATALRGRHANAGSTAPRVVHGSPHMHQWLDDRGALGLVDFDRLAVGEVELDAATFLAELDYEGGLSDRVEDFQRSLTAGYAEAGIMIDTELLATYRMHKWVAKLGRTAAALRPDRTARVDRVLRRIESVL